MQFAGYSSVSAALGKLEKATRPPELPPHRELFIGLERIWYNKTALRKFWGVVDRLEGLESSRNDVGYKGHRVFLCFGTISQAVKANCKLLITFPDLTMKLSSPPAKFQPASMPPASMPPASTPLNSSPITCEVITDAVTEDPEGRDLLAELLALLIIPL
jgi:hypothetical protein